MTPEVAARFAALSVWKTPFKQRFDELCIRAKQIVEWHGKTWRKPDLHFVGRGNRAGYADYADNVIGLNPTYCQSHNNNMLNDTIPHELAHFMVDMIYGYKNVEHHGAEWYAMFGALTWRTPSRLHNYGSRDANLRRLAANKAL